MRRSTIPVLLLPLALAVGCSSDSDGPGTTTSPSSPSSSAGDAVSDSGSPVSSPSSDPSTELATGITLSMPNSSVRAPADWTHAKDLTRYEDGADSPDTFSYIMLGEIDAFGSSASAQQLGQNRIKANVYDRTPKLLPVADLAGTPAYHIAGFVSPTQYIEELGTIVRDKIVTLTFSFNNKVPKAERDAVVASVLPTFAWK